MRLLRLFREEKTDCPFQNEPSRRQNQLYRYLPDSTRKDTLYMKIVLDWNAEPVRADFRRFANKPVPGALALEATSWTRRPVLATGLNRRVQLVAPRAGRIFSPIAFGIPLPPGPHQN